MAIQIIPWDTSCTMLTHFKVAKTTFGITGFYDTA
jgi:hypothetical protein